jgi:hypothetical protein
MDVAMNTTSAILLRAALSVADSSSRLQSALAAGTHPRDEYVDVLVERCAVEPDFYVRDMLTWALTRHPADLTVPLLLAEVKSDVAQARSQALHTLSKIGDPRGWAAVTPELLKDADAEVARAAWRAAVVLVAEGEEGALAGELALQLGRGDRSVQLSLSRALAALGEAGEGAVAVASTHRDENVRLHALATERLMRDPDESFEAAVWEAQRIVALGGETPNSW